MDSFEAFRLIYKILLWAGHKEENLYKGFSSNPYIDCYYYENTDMYALLNNVDKELKTTFYDMDGKKQEMSLKGFEIKWIKK